MRIDAVVAGLLLLASPSMALQTSPSEAFVQWGATHASPMRSLGLTAPYGDLQPIRQMIGASRLMVLGEPVHGAHEPLAFRNRLFRFLVLEAGFTAIGLETGMPEAAALQAYIDGGAGDAHTVARGGFTWGFGDFAENAELLEWMREYNRTARKTRRLRVYGIDLSGSDDDAAATRLQHAIDPAITWLRRTDSASATTIEASFQPHLLALRTQPHSALPPVARDRLSAAIGDLVAELKRNRTSTVARTDDRAFQLALRGAVVARQLDAFWRAMPVPDGATGIPPGVWRPMTARDGALADNAAWAFAQEGASGKLLVFAHNTHAMNSALFGGTASVFSVPPPMMGQYLRARFGRELFIMGFSARTAARGFSPTPLDSAGIDVALSRMRRTSFVLNLREAPEAGVVSHWLRSPHPLQVNFNQQVHAVPITAFDAFVFVDSLSRAHRN